MKDFKFQTLSLPGKVPLPHAFLMVDFDFIRQECPSTSFFFARLGVYLEYSSGGQPQVGLYMSRFIAFKIVLLSLYPLIRHSLIKYHLEMTNVEYRGDDVRKVLEKISIRQRYHHSLAPF